SGSALEYSTFLGGSDDDCAIYMGHNGGCALAMDAAGDVFVAGSTESTNFPTTSDAYDTTINGDIDAFVTRLDLGGGTMHVASIQPGYSVVGGQYRVFANVTIRDSTGLTVPAATVSLAIGVPGGQVVSAQATTNG